MACALNKTWEQLGEAGRNGETVKTGGLGELADQDGRRFSWACVDERLAVCDGMVSKLYLERWGVFEMLGQVYAVFVLNVCSSLRGTGRMRATFVFFLTARVQMSSLGCFKYDEVTESFEWWGHSAELGLINTGGICSVD